jgi:two-component system, OmpR family, response regulator protein BraR/BceR
MYKILIVEDDLIIAKTMKNHIKSWGFEAECVTDFKDVLAAFVSYNPQLVLLDITLPFFNGYHWCSEIRRHSKVPIVFISSASDNMNIVMAMNMGGTILLQNLSTLMC